MKKMIKRKKVLLFLLLAWLLIVETLISFFKFPGAVRYVCDLIYVILGIFLMKDFPEVLDKWKPLKWIGLAAALFLLEAIFSTIINGSAWSLFLWAARNTFRFYVVYLAAVAYLEEKDFFDIFKWAERAFWLNGILMCVQFFIMGKRDDFLGGVFGIQQGCNSYTNIFFCLIITYAILCYLDWRISLPRMGALLIASAVLSAMAEIKIFFIEMAVILVLCMLFYRKSRRTLILVGMGILVFCVGLLGVWMISPGHFEYLVNPASMLEYATSQAYYNDTAHMGRINVFSYVNEKFFRGDLLKCLWGLGFGHCENSKLSFFNSVFYQEFGWTDYRAYSSAMLYLETGIIGLILTIVFFADAFLLSFNAEKQRQDTLIHVFVMIVSIISVFLLFFNNSMRAEPGYMMYIALAFGGVLLKKGKEGGVECSEY